MLLLGLCSRCKSDERKVTCIIKDYKPCLWLENFHVNYSGRLDALRQLSGDRQIRYEFENDSLGILYRRLYISNVLSDTVWSYKSNYPSDEFIVEHLGAHEQFDELSDYVDYLVEEEIIRVISFYDDSATLLVNVSGCGNIIYWGVKPANSSYVLLANLIKNGAISTQGGYLNPKAASIMNEHLRAYPAEYEMTQIDNFLIKKAK
jgi:hypothetical protein